PEQRNQILGGATALLHLIQFDEPFGLSMVDAMACGTPVIAYGRGSVPEIIRHGETGWIASGLADAVAAVSIVRTLNRAQIRATAAKRFSRERMVDDYLQIYKGIL
ncbi:MAG: glycosyltransferase, partial [Chloroflexia bacterium]|nr:glycosyltransferase [Chloroflexia bacterium]